MEFYRWTITETLLKYDIHIIPEKETEPADSEPDQLKFLKNRTELKVMERTNQMKHKAVIRQFPGRIGTQEEGTSRKHNPTGSLLSSMNKSRTFAVICSAVVLTAFALTVSSCSMAPPPEPEVLELEGDLGVHDPVIIYEDDTFYVFATGGGRRSGGVIPIRSSKDMYNWTACGHVFETLPEWVAEEVPRARGSWAPDISYYNGKYHLERSKSWAISGLNG